MSDGPVRGSVGTVFIAVDIEVTQSTVVYVGYWDGGRAVLEQMPEMGRASDAIRWGLERTDDVRIRVDDHEHFWAGLGSPPEGDPGFVGTITLDNED